MTKKQTPNKSKNPKKGKKVILKKKKNQIPKFNFYWIYGIIAFFMISMLFTNEMGSLSVETNRQTLINEYIKNKDVEKIEIIENKNIAKIFIKESSLSEHRHEAVSEPMFGEGLNPSLNKKKFKFSIITNKVFGIAFGLGCHLFSSSLYGFSLCVV